MHQRVFKAAIKTPHGKALQGILLCRETTESTTHLSSLPTPSSWLQLQLHYAGVPQLALWLGAKSEVQSELQNIKSKAGSEKETSFFDFSNNKYYISETFFYQRRLGRAKQSPTNCSTKVKLESGTHPRERALFISTHWKWCSFINSFLGHRASFSFPQIPLKVESLPSMLNFWQIPKMQLYPL